MFATVLAASVIVAGVVLIITSHVENNTSKNGDMNNNNKETYVSLLNLEVNIIEADIYRGIPCIKN